MRSRVATILEDDEDDDIEIDRPRLSLPLEEDDDSDLHPPRLSDVADYTARSVEMPRRALSEQPRLSRGSPGSIRMSDFRGADLDEEMEFGVDSGYFPGANFDDAGLGAAGEDVTYERYTFPFFFAPPLLEHPTIVQKIDKDPRIDEERRQTLAMNRESFGLEMPDINESTFVMNLQPPSDGEPEPGPADDTAPIFDLEAEVDVNDEEGADDMEEEMAGQETQVNGADATETGELSRVEQLRRKRKRGIKVSAFGVEYPSLPPPVIKRIAQSYARTSGIPKTKISPDTLAALSQASDWFFEQLGDSLQAYAKHAGRKTIDESDVITLMRRFVPPTCGYHLLIQASNIHLVQAAPSRPEIHPFLSCTETFTPRAPSRSTDVGPGPGQEAAESKCGRRRRRMNHQCLL